MKVYRTFVYDKFKKRKRRILIKGFFNLKDIGYAPLETGNYIIGLVYRNARYYECNIISYSKSTDSYSRCVDFGEISSRSAIMQDYEKGEITFDSTKRRVE